MKFFFLLGVLGVLAVQGVAVPQIQTVSSNQKLTATERGMLEPFAPEPIHLQAARGEWESFQVVVSADEDEIKNASLQATALVSESGVLAAQNVETFRENYVYVSHPSGNRTTKKLWWPDALIPLALQPSTLITAHRSEVFWVTIKVPREAKAGEYSGVVNVFCDGRATPVVYSLRVENIEMPAPTLRSNVAVYYEILKDWYAKNLHQNFDEKLKREYYEFLLDYRINAYDLPVAWTSPEAAKYLRDPRVLSVRLPPLDDKTNFDLALKTLRENHALNKAYYYRIDEPSPDDYARVMETEKQLKAIDPELKQCVTVHANESLKNAVDIWCPNIGDFFGLGHLDETMLARERRKGNETWWYTMIEPKYPYPTWLLDDAAQSVRSYGALMARYGISGFVYSMAHGWGPKPLENLQSFAGTNGDGTLLYPSELVSGSGPMPSIRLMLLRDAIEDYELMRAGLKPIPKLPNGLLREKIKFAEIAIPTAPKNFNARWFAVSHDAKTIFVVFRATTSTLEKDWCAVELAPPNLAEKFRFVVTSGGKGIVEKHTREGGFELQDFDWKFAAKKSDDGYNVEMKIPLSIIGNAKTFRFNALRRDGSTLQIVRAFPDAGDVTLMPIVTLNEHGA